MSKVWLTGAGGMVASSLLQKMRSTSSYQEIIATSSKDLDLRNQKNTANFVTSIKPDIAILCAARVGGVLSNSTYPAIFSIENQLMQMNALQALVDNGARRIIFIGSSCIYPKDAKLPLTPESLNTGPFEPTNRWYAMAKLSMIFSLEAVAKQYGIKVNTVLPTNLYGPGDNFHELDGHVVPSLIHKAHRAKVENQVELEVWGSGKPFREVLFVEDFAEAIICLLKTENSPEVLNVGSGEEYSIKDIAEKIAQTVQYSGSLKFEANRPDGVFRKTLDSTPIRELGWRPKTSFELGLKETYSWYLENVKRIRLKGVN